MKILKYPDGTSYVELGSLKEYMSENTDELNIVFKINNYEDLWHLKQFSDCLRGTDCTVTIPNLIDAQADRRFSFNHSSGLKLVCEFLNSMKNLKFKIFHPHNPEVVEALIDNVEIIDNQLFIQEVLNKLAGKEKDFSYQYLDNLILMASDAGGFKPLMKLCDNLKWKGETYSASKARTEEELKQLVDRQDFQGKDILIIDDICVYGRTFKGLSKILKERNCGKLYLAVSHMTVQSLGKDSVTNYFDKVFTTNSKFEEYKEICGSGIPEKIESSYLEVIKMF